MDNSSKSFSLGRLDIVDLYDWKSKDKLVYKTYFQRQFVWKEKDKRELIDTIMKGLPIPSIFICDSGLDLGNLTKKYNVLDGRQRLESIFEFLENGYKYKGVFFSEMSEDEKRKILNYNITLIQLYIDPDDTNTIKEVFKRLNKSAYNLNRIEKQSTQLVEYDYMIIAKIVSGIIWFENIDSYLNEIDELFSEDDNEDEIDTYSPDLEREDSISSAIKEICSQEKIKNIKEVLTTDIVFSDYDRRRQINLQYFLNIFSSIVLGEIINRNVKENVIIELSDWDKMTIAGKLNDYDEACKFILELLDGEINEFWRNKTSFFTLSYLFATHLEHIRTKGIDDIRKKLSYFQQCGSPEWDEYLKASQQGVNDVRERKKRNDILEKVLLLK